MIPKRKLFSLVLLALPLITFSQENSPYSRYGVGNLTPQGNILNRGMGGISAGYSDATSLNYLNPASYGRLYYTTLDIGAQFDSRTLRSKNPEGKFNTKNGSISYLQVGFPLLVGNKKALEKKIGWGVNLGLKPVSNIAYKIQRDSRIANLDSITTIFEGSGGLNEVFAGTGVQLKNFAFGVNAGYVFGSKNHGTRLIFINDTINYLKSNSATRTSIGGLSLHTGAQYAFSLKKGDTVKGVLRVGAYARIKKNYNAKQDILRESFSFNAVTGSTDPLDSIFERNDQKGTVVLPATYGVGFTVEKEHWLYGADFEMTNWDDYTFYGQKDLVANNWTVKAGFQYYPAKSNSRKYSQFIRYRAGVSLGPDYIVADKKLPQFLVSIGAGLPLKLRQAYYETQRSVVNLGLEYGNRGNNSNNLRENMVRITAGFSLSDIWFRRYKYQ